MRVSSFLCLFSLFFLPLLAQPGVRLTITESYINEFLQKQLPKLLPKTITIPEISKNTSHSVFLMNLTEIALANLDLDYLTSQIALNSKKNSLSLIISRKKQFF